MSQPARHRLRHDELRYLRRRLVRLVGQPGRHQQRRPDESLALQPELLAADRLDYRWTRATRRRPPGASSATARCGAAPAPPARRPRDRDTGAYSSTNIPAPGQASIAALSYLINNRGTATGKVKAGGPIGHTRWTNGGVYYSGFITAITPDGEPTTISCATGF